MDDHDSYEFGIKDKYYCTGVRFPRDLAIAIKRKAWWDHRTFGATVNKLCEDALRKPKLEEVYDVILELRSKIGVLQMQLEDKLKTEQKMGVTRK